MLSSYRNFVKKICQPRMNPSASPTFIVHEGAGRDDFEYNPELEGAGPLREKLFLAEAQRLQIVIALSPGTCPSVIKYAPTHIIYKTPCMVRQVRAFDLRIHAAQSSEVATLLSSSSSLISPLPLDDVDPNNPYHVVVRELSFGQVLEGDVCPPVLCFNVPESHFKVCSIEDERRYNREQKKNKARRRSHNSFASNVFAHRPSSVSCNSTAATSSTPPPLLHLRLFQLYYTNDSAMFDLIQSTFRLEMEKLIIAAAEFSSTSDADSLYYSSIPHSLCVPYTTSTIMLMIESRELEISKMIEAMNRFFMRSLWPVNQGRAQTSADTPIPPATGIYMPPHRHNGGFQTRQWNSFVRNIRAMTTKEFSSSHRQFISDENVPAPPLLDEHSPLVALFSRIEGEKVVPGGDSPDDDDNGGTTCVSTRAGTSNSVSCGGRLRIFQDLANQNKTSEEGKRVFLYRWYYDSR